MNGSILVNTYHNNANLELLINRSITIYNLIESLRTSDFVSKEIPNSRLICRNRNKEIVDGNSQVSTLIAKENGTLELYLDLKAQSRIEEAVDEKGINYTVQLLKIIIKKVEAGRVDYLIAAKQNRALNSAIGQKISEIGQLFQKPISHNAFYKDSLKQLTDFSSNEDLQDKMETVYDTYMDDDIQSQTLETVKKLVKIIQNLQNDISSKEISLQSLNSELKDREQKILSLQRKFRYESSQIQDSVLQLKSQIQKYKNQIIQLTTLNQSKDKQIQNAKNAIKSSEQQQLVLAQRFDIEKSAFKTELNRVKTQLASSAFEINDLNQALSKKQSQLFQKDEQIQKIKENSVDKKVVSLADKLSRNQAIFPLLNQPKIGHLQDILIDSNLANDLKKIIENQMEKPISKIHQLLSYDRRDHMIYSLKQNFQSLIHQKRSLLLIAFSEGPHGKFFGAFTQEKYDMAPSSYFIPDFNGCSFLFSLINKRFEHFKILDGENSIVFDLDSLVFGNEDLVLDFEKSRCQSKFTEGKSDAYNLDSESGGRDDFKLFFSDKQPEKGKSCVNLVQYKIYEVQFD